MAEDMTVPDQPDGIENDSFDLPKPKDAAARVDLFLEWFGDGRVETLQDGPRPLYARDLQALTNAVRDLLWLHAEAVWRADCDHAEMSSAESEVSYLSDEIADLQAERDRERASRQAWAEEAMRLLEVLDRLEQAALNPAALYSGVLVGVGGKGDTPPNDEQCQRAAGLIERAIRRAMGPYYVTQAEERLVRAIGDGRACACVSDEQAAALVEAGFARTQCAVHPVQAATLTLTDTNDPTQVCTGSSAPGRCTSKVFHLSGCASVFPSGGAE